eukprot:2843476-Rhodomonas_salina.1
MCVCATADTGLWKLETRLDARCYRRFNTLGGVIVTGPAGRRVARVSQRPPTGLHPVPPLAGGLCVAVVEESDQAEQECEVGCDADPDDEKPGIELQVVDREAETANEHAGVDATEHLLYADGGCGSACLARLASVAVRSAEVWHSHLYSRAQHVGGGVGAQHEQQSRQADVEAQGLGVPLPPDGVGV